MAASAKNADRPYNWLRVFSQMAESAEKPAGLGFEQPDTNRLESRCLWRSKWAKARRGKRFQRDWASRRSSNLPGRIWARAVAAPARKLSAQSIFNYILRLLYPGCQWKELPIDKDRHGHPEIHYTRIYRAFRR
jgi:hypothetical protein